jgi:urease accessory protein
VLTLALLQLADGRFPVGGHAHSGGVESAVLDGRIACEADVEAYLLGRLHTTGLTDAALAAAVVVRGGGELLAIDAEAEARIPVPALRTSSRRLGRQLVRAAGRCWPAGVLVTIVDLLPAGAHQSVALGAAAVAAGLSADDVAALAVHHALTTPGQAAVRLLGLDPYGVAAMTARLGEEAAAVAARAVVAAAGELIDLPAGAGPVCEIAAAGHADIDGRLFVT